MKIDINDPRITAFALGELQGTEATEMARVVREDPKVRAAVDAVRETSFLLMEAFEGEAPMLTPAHRQKVRSAGGVVISDIEQVSKAKARSGAWQKMGVVGLGLAATIALMVYWGGGGAGSSDLTHSSTSQKSVSSSLIRSVAQVSGHAEGDWVAVKSESRVAVPFVSGEGSWALLKSFVNEQHALPPRGAVRIEELVNHFEYTTPSQLTLAQNATRESVGRVAADLEMCKAPWNAKRWLVAVNVAAKSVGDLKSAQLKLTFDPDRVERVRLLGYGKSQTANALSAEDGVQGEVKNYVLYEVQPAKVEQIENGASLVTLTMSGGGTLGSSQLTAWADASEDLRFASLMAGSGMWMSGSYFKDGAPANLIRTGVDSFDFGNPSALSEARREALSLVQKALALPISAK